MTSTHQAARACRTSRAGFSLPELMVVLTLLLIVSGTVMSGMVTMMKSQAQTANRTEMHSSVRSATELLEQEITQAGRISLPAAVTLSSAVASGATSATISSSTGMFVGEQLTIDTFNLTGASSPQQETVTISAISGNTLTVSAFTYAHAQYAPVTVLGALASGVVPPAASPASYTNGSTGSVLKLYGDINGDGNIVYIEYTCDTTTTFKLYRNVMAYNASSKPAVNNGMVLLNNIQPNPNGTACFTYQPMLVGTTYYVVDVAVTLTVETQNPDAWTGTIGGQSTLETKALLNISPRNVFEAWELGAINQAGFNDRVQPIPANVTCLLAANASGCNYQ